jgi:hypothetical protein
MDGLYSTTSTGGFCGFGFGAAGGFISGFITVPGSGVKGGLKPGVDGVGFSVLVTPGTGR